MISYSKFTRLFLASSTIFLLAGCAAQTDKSTQDKTVSPETLRDNSQSDLYVAMGPGNSIGVVDITTNKLKYTLPAGNNPHGIAVASNEQYAFTTSTKMGKGEMIMEPDHGGEMNMEQMMKMGSDEIIVTDILKKEIIRRINVGGGSHHMTITPDGAYVLATVPSRSGVAFIDTTLLEMTQFIETGIVPNYVSVSPDGKKAYVTNKGEDTLAVIDLQTGEFVTTIPTEVRPDHITVSPDSKFVYITNGGSDTVSVIDTVQNETVAIIAVGEAPHGIDITPDGSKLYVSDSESKTVSVISVAERKVVQTISMENKVEHASVTPDGAFAYVNSESAGIIYVISTSSDDIVKKISVGKEPHQTAFP